MHVSHRDNIAVVVTDSLSDHGSIVVLVYEIAESDDDYGRGTEID
jgi:hypothetical protein